MPRRRHRAGAWLEAPNPNARTGWRLCWTDPISGKVRKVTLDPARYPNEAAREKALESKSLTTRTATLDKREGVVSMPLRDALGDYVADSRRLRAVTLTGYERAGEIFVQWCETQQPPLQFARELTKSRLAQFRASRINKTSDRNPDEVRSATAVNNELRAIKTMLIAWTRHDWTPDLTRDQISDALRHEQDEQDEIEFLKPVQCRALLRAWLAADAATFKLTRDGSTNAPRWPAMAPFCAVVMLSGMRRAEALGLTWNDVSLDEQTILLRASAVKTKRARRFEMSPGLQLVMRGLWLKYRDRPKRAPTDRVFSELTVDTVEAARKRLAKREKGRDAGDELLAHVSNSNVGPWSWQALRRTAATVLANMPTVGPWVESKMLGHSVVVSERLYAGRLKVPATAKTIEAALGVEKELTQIARAVGSATRDR